MQKFLFTMAAVLLITMNLKAQDKPTFKWSGLIFGDYYYNMQRDNGIDTIKNAVTNGHKDLNGFQFRRIDVTLDANVTNSVTARVRVENDNAELQPDGKLGIFIKDAWFKFNNIFSGSDLMVGIMPTLAYEVSEDVWGHRFIEKTILDLHGIISSRDFGIALKGKIDEDGIFKYGLMYGNNSSNKLELDKYKRYSANIQISPIKNLTVNIDADYRAAAPIPDASSSATPKPMINNDAMTITGFIGYSEKDHYRFGVEVFLNSVNDGVYHSATKNYDSKKAMGATIFGNYMFMKELGIFFRYDHFDTDVTNITRYDATDYIIAGLDWVNGNLTISPNVLIENYKVLANDTQVKSSITPRVTFFYTF